MNYPSGKKTDLIQNDTHQKFCKALIRGTNVDSAIVEALCQSNPACIITGAAKIVKLESVKVCKRGSGCPLQKKDYSDFFNFSWDHLHEYFRHHCPALLSIISATVCDLTLQVSGKPYQHIILTACIGLHGRSQEMSLVQFVVGFMLKHGGCTEHFL